MLRTFLLAHRPRERSEAKEMMGSFKQALALPAPIHFHPYLLRPCSL